jgi:hypothetical protein
VKTLLHRLPIAFALLVVAAMHAQSSEDFARKLYPVLEKAQCRLCHNDNGVASRTRLRLPREEATPEEIASFGLRLSALVDRSDPEQSLLLRKPTNRLQHTGGERIHPGSEEEKILVAWIQYLATLPENPSPGTVQGVAVKPQPAVVRRLTHSQYNQTVADLLGDQTRPADRFPQEDYINGFTNQAAGQSISPVQEEAYSRAAAKLARNAFRGGDQRRLLACRPSGPDDAACRQKFIREFGRKAFRRPLTAAEVARFEKLFRLDAAASQDFLRGAQLVVEAMLQSPSFLFHLEQGPEQQFEQFRTASRLSYFLWDTMPDEVLFRAAAAGELRTPQQIGAAAARMLDDPRARNSMDVFLSQWLRFDRLKSAIRDHRFYPDFSAELVESMLEETRRLFHHLVWENGNFTELFTSSYAYVNNDLAQLYGVAPPKQAFARVDFPSGSQRAGILGQAAFLTLTGKPSETSPTERGLFIREHFLCQIVPPPPPGVNTTLPPPTDEKPLTNRQMLQAHLSNPTCSACHRLIDPIGFGLEHYDAVGRYREQQVVTIYPTFDEITHHIKTKPTEHRLPLDTAAFVLGIPNSQFEGPRALGQILAGDPACQRCVVKQLFRYAVGRPEGDADQPVIDASLEVFRKSQFNFQKLIIAIINSKPFLGGGS